MRFQECIANLAKFSDRVTVVHIELSPRVSVVDGNVLVLALGAGGPDVSPEVLREMRFSGIQSSSLAALGWTVVRRARFGASVAF